MTSEGADHGGASREPRLWESPDRRSQTIRGTHGRRPPRQRRLQEPGRSSDHLDAAPRESRDPAVTTTAVSRRRRPQRSPRGFPTARGSDTTTTGLSRRSQRSGTWKATSGMRDRPWTWRRKGGLRRGKVPASGGGGSWPRWARPGARGGRRAAGEQCRGKARRKAADGPTMCRLTCANVAERPRIYGILARELPPLCALRTRLFRHR